MKKVFRFSLMALLCANYLILGLHSQIVYPEAYRSNDVDIIWETPVTDPYRWLERLNSAQTTEWVNAQEIITKQNTPALHRQLSRYLRAYSVIDYNPVIKEGNLYFTYVIDNIHHPPVLYYQRGLKTGMQFLFDPRSIDKSSNLSIDGIRMSGDNKILALILSDKNSDWKSIRFFDMESKKLLKDSIIYVKYSNIEWSHEGVFYVRYEVEETNESLEGTISGRKLYHHRMGTSQNEDVLIFEPEYDYEHFGYDVTPRGNYLILYHSLLKDGSIFNSISLIDLPLMNDFEPRHFIVWNEKGIDYSVIGEINDKLLVKSNFDSPNEALYLFYPDSLNFGEVFIPPYLEKLDYVKLVGDKILHTYSDDKKSYAVLSDYYGRATSGWSIPEGYSFTRFYGEPDDNILVYYFNSYFSPVSIYYMDLNKLKREKLGKTKIQFDNTNLVTQKVHYTAKDGVQIPLYLTYRDDIKLNGNNPVLLDVYGGFGIPAEPFFSLANVAFVRSGGILAVPALRGGGDFPGWHEQGKRLNKQTTFNDFIAAAEFLIKNYYTNPSKIAAMGASHGGLVVAACMIQRPNLFNVVVAESGVLDMMRYHLFNIGYIYEGEFGNIRDSLDFLNLISYSPLHNLREGVNYPATLLVASENDDRVPPFHSFKFLSELQSKGSGKNPYLLYYQRGAGHSGSSIKVSEIDREAYIYSFIFKHLGMEGMARRNM